MKNASQLYDLISWYTLTARKLSAEELNKIIYDNFKKRRIGLLDTYQLEKVAQILEAKYGRPE